MVNDNTENVEKHVVNGYAIEELPKEAMSLGTLCRTKRFDRLGVIVDAFYGEKDKNGNNIIFYTILSFPESSNSLPRKDEEPYFLSNEYEYDIIAYLMLPPLDLERLAKFIKEPLL